MAPFATSVHAHDAAGQNHDIISDHGAAADLPSDPVEITAMQKMLSATSGSLLTGLLGMYHRQLPTECRNKS
jgi:solute carrier family 25 protein 39/40